MFIDLCEHMIASDSKLHCESTVNGFYHSTLYTCILGLMVGNRDVTILQYIDILQYSLLQYNTIRLIKISISQHLLPSKL